MKETIFAFFTLALMCLTSACSGELGDPGEISPPVNTSRENGETSEVTRSETDPLSEEMSAVSESERQDKKEENIVRIEITVQDQTFSAELYDNETAEKFAQMLPLTLDMSELNGNEKYYYLETDLPANASVPSSGIRSGDIMLYGSGCLVLFYDSFSTSYSYTPIGHMSDTDGLAEALGKGSAAVEFKAAE